MPSSLRSRAERDQLVLSHLRLAHFAATRFGRRHRELAAALGAYDDLVATAHIGLIRAAECWDSGRGVRFSTYAVRCCFSYLWRAGVSGGLIRLPESLDREHREAAWARIRWTDWPRTDADGRPWEPAAPPEAIHDVLEIDRVREAVRLLPRRLRRIIRGRFYRGLTLLDLAAELGISRERVRQLEVFALRRLRRAITGTARERAAPAATV